MKHSNKRNLYKRGGMLVTIISASIASYGLLRPILRRAKTIQRRDKSVAVENNNNELASALTRPDDKVQAQPQQVTVTSSNLPIWTARIQELNGQANEYFRAITTGIWYYTAAVLVTVGWIFTSLKNLTDLSNIFQFKELISTYPNLGFPVLGLVLINQIYVTVCCGLGYLLFMCRLRLRWVHGQFINSGVFEPVGYTKLAPFYTGLAISVFLIPFLISALILWRFPIWIEDITSPIVRLLQVIHLALLIYYIIDLTALIWGILDLFSRFKSEGTGIDNR